MNSLFTEISIIIVIATLLAGLMHALKQPLIMGHILTGLIVGPYVLDIVNSVETLETFSKIGIAILLFIVGLGLSPKVIKDVGKIAVITGIGQIIFTTLFGFLITKFIFGYTTTISFYIAIALTFSSTIIILKLLSDKKDLEKLYGKIAIGFLLVQDIAATLILLIVSASALGAEQNALNLAVMTFTKALGLVIITGFVSVYILPKLSTYFAKSQEFLFLFSVAWGLGMAVAFDLIGLSIEIGALAAGATLAVSPYVQDISSKLKPLRDFFIILFFVLLGAEMALEDIRPLMGQAIFLSLFVLIGNPLIVFVLMGLQGYSKKTFFRAGLTVAQISEFSLILIVLALKQGQVTNQVLSLVTIVGLITIAGSTYLILYEDKIFPYISKLLSIFEKKEHLHVTDILKSYEVILFGSNTIGQEFIDLFKKLGQSFLVIDFDPILVKKLTSDGINVIYGDAEDTEFLEDLNVEESKLVVSAIPNYETNQFLINKVQGKSNKIIIIVISYSIDEALELYKQGASYVILPHFIGGRFAAMMTAEHWLNIDTFNMLRDNHINELKQRKELGHIHPQK